MLYAETTTSACDIVIYYSKKARCTYQFVERKSPFFALNGHFFEAAIGKSFVSKGRKVFPVVKRSSYSSCDENPQGSVNMGVGP